jgi:hypothetical protein
LKKFLVVAGIVVPTFVGSFTWGAYSMKRVMQKQRGDFSLLTSTALKNIFEKAAEGNLTQDELNDLVDKEMSFISMSMNS